MLRQKRKMMENPNEKDEAIYADIRKALPKGMVRFVDNYDDVNYGWDICPDPGILIQFKVNMSDPMRISIKKYGIIVGAQVGHMSVIQATLFSGLIPPNSHSEPDYDFIRKILTNYKSFC